MSSTLYIHVKRFLGTTREFGWWRRAFGPDGRLYFTESGVEQDFRFDVRAPGRLFAAGGPGGPDQGADARPDDVRRLVPVLHERLQHAHVGQALHAPAAQDECEACVEIHRARRLP